MIITIIVIIMNRSLFSEADIQNTLQISIYLCSRMAFLQGSRAQLITPIGTGTPSGKRRYSTGEKVGSMSTKDNTEQKITHVFTVYR